MQSWRFFSFQIFRKNVVPEKGGGGLCFFWKYTRNGCFRKVWVIGGPQPIFFEHRRPTFDFFKL